MQENVIQIVNAQENVTVQITGEPAEMNIGGNGYDGNLAVLRENGSIAIQLEGDNSDIFIADIEKEIIHPDQLEDLQDMASFLLENQHLPGFPSTEMLRPGYRVKQFMIKLIRMQEFLVLQTADLQAKLDALQVTS